MNAGWPILIDATYTCGTLTKIRSVAVSAMRNNSVPADVLVADINAPTSKLRALIVPVNGAVTFSKLASAVSRSTFASSTLTFAQAAESADCARQMRNVFRRAAAASHRRFGINPRIV